MPKIAIVACETTGFKAKNEIVGLAVVICDVNERGDVENLIEWYGEQEPKIRDSEKKSKSTYERELGYFFGKSMNIGVLEGLLLDVDIIISHNAKVDAKYLGRLIPNVLEKEWRCSYKQWSWQNMENGRLETLCYHLHIERPEKPLALDDAKALLTALEKSDRRAGVSERYLIRLLKKEPYNIGRSRKNEDSSDVEESSKRGFARYIPGFLPPSLKELIVNIIQHQNEAEDSKKKK